MLMFLYHTAAGIGPVQIGTGVRIYRRNHKYICVHFFRNWIKLYSEVRVDDNTVMTAKQIKELQKRNAQLEEENIILKKALAIMTPRSGKE